MESSTSPSPSLPVPDRLGDVATKVLFENDRVRVWEMVLEPGQSSDWHRHDHPYLLCIVEGDTVDALGDDGRQFTLEAKPGTVFYVPPGDPEIATNRSSTPFREVLIELKDGPFTGPEKTRIARISDAASGSAG